MIVPSGHLDLGLFEAMERTGEVEIFERMAVGERSDQAEHAMALDPAIGARKDDHRQRDAEPPSLLAPTAIGAVQQGRPLAAERVSSEGFGGVGLP